MKIMEKDQKAIRILVNKLEKSNESYRIGKPIISDSDYDKLVDQLFELDPENDFFSQIGHVVVDENRKSPVPIMMASMNKVKSIGELNDWLRLKAIKDSEECILTPKFDGLSLCVNELNSHAWTRGDGKIGQKSNDHYNLITNKLNDIIIPSKANPKKLFTYGEVMMLKSTFEEKYSEEFENPRNLVAGLLNSKEISPFLKDCIYIKYGVQTDNNPFQSKSDLIKWLNSNQNVKVPFKTAKFSDLTEELFLDLFKQWSLNFEIDGIIVEVNDLNLQNKLGRERSSNNPVWARAFKSPSFEQSALTEILGISWNISKQGYLKPTLHVNPVRLDGVTVSNVTGNNAKFVRDMGIGVGSIVKVKRSGMVIPIIAEVIKKVEFRMPNIPNIGWNENGVELITLSETDDQKLKQLIAFFSILETDNVSEGVIKQLWDAGYKTVKDILSLGTSELEKIDRFGKRKASIVYNAIQNSISNVDLAKLQHATGIFKGLGSKKLQLLSHFTSKPSIDEILQIEGFAEKSAQSYLDGYDIFNQFISDLPISIKNRSVEVSVKEVSTSNNLNGKTFVFTGIRRKDLEQIILDNGGKIGGSVSKTTSYLIMKEIGSGSSKEKKAIEMGTHIMTVEDLESMLKSIN